MEFTPLSDGLNPVTEQIQRLRATNSGLDNNIRQYTLYPNYWDRSFSRFHERLSQRGIEIPKNQIALEQEFLDIVKA